MLEMCKTMSFDEIYLVEPLPIHAASIQAAYRDIPNVRLDMIAIVPTPMPTVDLFYTEDDGPASHPCKSYEVASIRPQHLLKHNYTYPSLKKVTVPALTLMEYFRTYALQTIDYLFLDIEGIDFEVLRTIEFDAIDIRRIQIEHIHLDKQELLRYMSERGYSPDTGPALSEYDTMFVKTK